MLFNMAARARKERYCATILWALSPFCPQILGCNTRHDASFCCVLENGSPRLKRNHEYYYQVQGQLAVTGSCGATLLYTPQKASPLKEYHLITLSGRNSNQGSLIFT